VTHDPAPGAALRRALAGVCAGLRHDMAAARTTVRLDAPGLGLDVDHAAAEAVAPGMAAIAPDGSIDQRSLATVRWLAARRRTLVQPRFGPPPRPPAALVDLYGVRAQILAPVWLDGTLAGWVSVHSATVRPWRPDEQARAERAAHEVLTLLQRALAELGALDSPGAPSAGPG